ncbi:stalk domain-containing protein [Paenibacillus shenyangensis]|uniref:stalk domain-containing protein n=1 Tax=Paenibacillus sp. A9 TaxID=1284352 RepID=UPI00035C0BED|nr:stalk domain-containing protein [Paenibacillus sp. A9]
MKFKKSFLVAVLASTQIVAAFPASQAFAAEGDTDTGIVQDVYDNAPNTYTVPSINPTTDTTGTDDQTGVDDGTTDEATSPADPATTPAVPATPTPTAPTTPAAPTTSQPSVVTDVYSAGPNKLIFMMNSNQIYRDGKLYYSNQPMTVKNGVSYVSVRALVERVGLTLTYDSKTKETVMKKDGKELRFTTDSKYYTVDGVRTLMKGPSYQQKSVFMVPLTSITAALNIPYTVQGKMVIMDLQVKPTASFTVSPTAIYATQTTVQYTTKSTTSDGGPVADERWTGREDIFAEAGAHVVTYQVMDSTGQWSDPYTVTINVLPPNQPPVAMFTTNSESYRMGEVINYTDMSTDDENAIDATKTQWVNKELAFFTPGPQTITLTVTDKHGATGTYSKTINITNDTLYTAEQFYPLFTPIGDSFNINGAEIPTWQTMTSEVTSEPVRLIRSNSPERTLSEGIVYQETATGPTRLMVHHLNETGKRVKMYVIATNTNATPATLNIQDVGFGGPNPYATAAGKVSIDRYYKSLQSGADAQTVVIQPGQSQIIFNQLNATTIKPDNVISLYGDLVSDAAVQYTVMMVDENADPIASMATLPKLDRDGIHNRGTYDNATRIMHVPGLIGNSNVRIPLGDNNSDPNLTGTDPLSMTEASNAGNFGVLYKIKLDMVAPNTLISFNARGGRYSGYIFVNGVSTAIKNNGAATSANDNVVIYRTGALDTESVEIWFTAAPGSNLPVNLLFNQLPAKKQ